MKFEKLEEIARGFSAAELDAEFRSLVADQRFAAVVAVVLQHKEQYTDGGCQQHLADKHGALAHNAGSVYALNVFLGKVRAVCDPPKRRGAKAPELPEQE